MFYHVNFTIFISFTSKFCKCTYPLNVRILSYLYSDVPQICIRKLVYFRRSFVMYVYLPARRKINIETTMQTSSIRENFSIVYITQLRWYDVVVCGTAQNWLKFTSILLFWYSNVQHRAGIPKTRTI